MSLRGVMVAQLSERTAIAAMEAARAGRPLTEDEADAVEAMYAILFDGFWSPLLDTLQYDDWEG